MYSRIDFSPDPLFLQHSSLVNVAIDEHNIVVDEVFEELEMVHTDAKRRAELLGLTYVHLYEPKTMIKLWKSYLIDGPKKVYEFRTKIYQDNGTRRDSHNTQCGSRLMLVVGGLKRVWKKEDKWSVHYAISPKLFVDNEKKTAIVHLLCREIMFKST